MSFEMQEIIGKTIEQCNGNITGGISDEQLACEITADLIEAGYGKVEEKKEDTGLPVKIQRKEVKEMPHYKDGSLANAGDVLKTKDGKVGTVVHISPGCESCNAQVATVRVSTPETAYWNDVARVIHQAGETKLAAIDIKTVTLGECEKVA